MNGNLKSWRLTGCHSHTTNPKLPHAAPITCCLAPAGRLEAIVTAPPAATRTALRTLCIDAGPAGDPHPEMVLADLVEPSSGRPGLDPAPNDVYVLVAPLRFTSQSMSSP
jgi:hypothetical protein